jgi:hypothetical protein
MIKIIEKKRKEKQKDKKFYMGGKIENEII